VELIGAPFLESRDAGGESLEEVVECCIREITAGGIAEEITFSRHGHGILLKLEVVGCIHLPKEVRLKNRGFEPYMCHVANMVGDRIVEVVGYEAACLACMQIHEEIHRCVVKYVVFENPGNIGQVSDWTSV
jgi:hypothetical protein